LDEKFYQQNQQVGFRFAEIASWRQFISAVPRHDEPGCS
jgi:hypothetical protein